MPDPRLAPDDAALIARSVQTPELFGQLFDRHFDVIHRYLRHWAGPGAADDLAAETFVRAFAARERFVAQGADARPWLFAIATNLLRDDGRGRARRARAFERLRARQVELPVLTAETPDPELLHAVRRLEHGEREALLLFAWAGLSYEEIAACLAIPVGTVRSRLSRARARLRDDLDQPSGAPSVAPIASEGALDV